MTLTAIRIPERIHRRALKVLANYHQRRVFPVRIHHKGYLSLKVNPWYRILSKDGGKSWELMSHETYNREIDK